MSGAALHALFDIAAWLAAGAAAWGLSRFSDVRFPSQSFELPYIAVLVFGAGLGAYLFGTPICGCPDRTALPARSRAPSRAASWRSSSTSAAPGITLRTGARFALPLAVGVAVGRIGCYLAGLDDFTYGTPTTLPWGHDFGDGIARHPVQLYESAAMAAFRGLLCRAGAPRRPLRDRERLLSGGRLLRAAALLLGVHQALWRRWSARSRCSTFCPS